MRASFRRCSLSFVALAVASCASAPLERFEFEEPAMGTTFRVVLYTSSRERADAAARAAFARVHDLDARLSDYREDSELMQVSHRSDAAVPTPWLDVSDDLWSVLARAREISGASEGAFDVTAGPVIALWRRARRQGELPRTERIGVALTSVGWRKLELDPPSHRVRLTAASMRLDLGGIAKGYALDRALQALAEHGVERALVDGGGDVAAGAAPPGARGWRVEIVPFDPSEERLALELAHSALATSGDAFQALELDGRRWSHIVDPRTGWALSNRTAASVIARDGATADACATTLCVLGLDDGLAWAQSRSDIEARIAHESERGIESAATPGFERRILSTPPRSPDERAPRP